MAELQSKVEVGPGLCPSRRLRVCRVPICVCLHLAVGTQRDVGSQCGAHRSRTNPPCPASGSQESRRCHRGRPCSGIRQPAITAAHPWVTNEQCHLPPASKHSGQLHHWSLSLWKM